MNWILAWTAILIGVAGLEIYGVYRDEPGDTITETVRTWISLIPFVAGRWIAKFLLSGLVAWLLLHIWELA